MDINDLKMYFSQVQYAKVQDDFKYSYKVVNGDYSLWNFECWKGGTYTLSISQVCERTIPQRESYKYSPTRMFLIGFIDPEQGITRDNIHYVGGGISRQARENYLECRLQKMFTYYLFVEVDWVPESQLVKQKFCITSYGPESVKFEV